MPVTIKKMQTTNSRGDSEKWYQLDSVSEAKWVTGSKHLKEIIGQQKFKTLLDENDGQFKLGYQNPNTPLTTHNAENAALKFDYFKRKFQFTSPTNSNITDVTDTETLSRASSLTDISTVSSTSEESETQTINPEILKKVWDAYPKDSHNYIPSERVIELMKDKPRSSPLLPPIPGRSREEAMGREIHEILRNNGVGSDIEFQVLKLLLGKERCDKISDYRKQGLSKNSAVGQERIEHINALNREQHWEQTDPDFGKMATNNTNHLHSIKTNPSVGKQDIIHENRQSDNEIREDQTETAKNVEGIFKLASLV